MPSRGVGGPAFPKKHQSDAGDRPLLPVSRDQHRPQLVKAVTSLASRMPPPLPHPSGTPVVLANTAPLSEELGKCTALGNPPLDYVALP